MGLAALEEASSKDMVCATGDIALSIGEVFNFKHRPKKLDGKQGSLPPPTYFLPGIQIPYRRGNKICKSRMVMMVSGMI